MSEDTELHRAIGRIEGKLDQYLRRQDALEARLTSTERKLWTLTGALAVLAVFKDRLLNTLFP